MDIYDMLKMWLFLQEKGHAATLPDAEFDNQIAIFFAEAEPGSLFFEHAGLFAALRLHHLVTTLSSLQAVEKDGLIPREIIRALMVDQWKTTLANEENPTAVNTVSLDDFCVNALRFGRLIENMPKCWRWTGFNNGVDIILNLSHGNLTMKRNCLSQSTPYSINLKTERMIHYRVIVSDGSGACIFDSAKQSVSLRLDEV
uniref:SEC63 domain-containing protein n=1 Tax=Heterorhabditis bacteriophora TaxID=37862 RepID=A0A1I7XR05_HETBA